MKEPVPVCLQMRCAHRVSAESEVQGRPIYSAGQASKIKCTNPTGICIARKVQLARLEVKKNGKIQE